MKKKWYKENALFLRRQIYSLQDEREVLIKRVSELEACNKDQEITIRQLMELVNDVDPVWNNTDLHPDPCFTRQDIENIVLDVLKKAYTGSLNR